MARRLRLYFETSVWMRLVDLPGPRRTAVTWDTADLAREKTRRLVAALGRQEDFRVPDIATPSEVLAEWLGKKTPS